MTTTPDFIRKCEMAEEIQAMRAQNVPLLKGEFRTHPPLKKGDWLAIRDYVEPGHTSIIVWDITPFLRGNDKIIWLPRTDELLDMLSGVEISPREVMGIFSSDREEKLLTVIMRNKFGKKWNGDNWESVK